MMKTQTLVVTFIALISFGAQASVLQEKMKFRDQDHVLSIYGSEAGAKKPGVLIVPEYWGKDELNDEQAKKLESQGYVVMVLDLYGENRHSKKIAEADRLQGAAEADGIEPMILLVEQALTRMQKLPGVDAERIAAVGFGYGGGLLLNVAKKGAPGLKAAVIFYGGVKNLRVVSQVSKLPKVLYVRPEKDIYVTKNEFESFRNDVSKSNLKLEILSLKNAHHGFVNKGIESYGRDDGGNTFMFYEPNEAEKAWSKTFDFLRAEMK